jgi:hypothetical protein
MWAGVAASCHSGSKLFSAYSVSCTFLLPILPTLPKRKKKNVETNSCEIAKKSAGKIINRASSLSSQKADLRHETTAWRLVQWAYADEHIRAANVDDGQYAVIRQESTLLGRLIDGVIGSGRGTINGKLNAHVDAFVVDGIVWQALRGRRGDIHHYNRLAQSFERRLPIYQEIVIEPLRFVQKRDERGRPEMLYPLRGRHEPIACILTVEGHSPEDAARMRADHWICWASFCDALQLLCK